MSDQPRVLAKQINALLRHRMNCPARSRQCDMCALADEVTRILRPVVEQIRTLRERGSEA